MISTVKYSLLIVLVANQIVGKERFARYLMELLCRQIAAQVLWQTFQ